MVLAMAFAAGPRRGHLRRIRMTLRAVERFVPGVIEREIPRCALTPGDAKSRAHTPHSRWRCIVALGARACLRPAMMARVALRLRDAPKVSVVCG
jgi:hypothetical protein